MLELKVCVIAFCLRSMTICMQVEEVRTRKILVAESGREARQIFPPVTIQGEEKRSGRRRQILGVGRGVIRVRFLVNSSGVKMR